MLFTHSVRVRIAVVVMVAMVGSPLAPLVEAQAPAAAPAAAPAGAKAPAGPAPLTGAGRAAYTTASGAALVLYQPQVTSWTDQKNLVTYAAMSYTPKGGKPALGTARVESDTSVALDERLVSFST